LNFKPKSCCICGEPLLTPHAIGGVCEEPGCDAVFCRYHWVNSNRRCREHGYTRVQRVEGRGQGEGRGERVEGRGQEEDRGERGGARSERGEDAENGDEGQAGLDSFSEKGQNNRKERNLKRWWHMKKSMKASMDVLKGLGAGGKALLAKLSGVKDPVEMHRNIQASLVEVTQRREDVATRLDAAHNDIVRKKKLRDTAVGARRQTLDAELKTLLSNYQALQRRMTGLLETERIMNLAILRLEEDQDNRIPGITENTLDDITDFIEESSDTIEDLRDAANDLEKAGARSPVRDGIDLDDALAGFDEEIPVMDELDDIPVVDEPVPETPRKEGAAEEV
jgi:hypothetical protein